MLCCGLVPAWSGSSTVSCPSSSSTTPMIPPPSTTRTASRDASPQLSVGGKPLVPLAIHAAAYCRRYRSPDTINCQHDGFRQLRDAGLTSISVGVHHRPLRKRRHRLRKGIKKD
ncbi:hypothetical protein N657DRAFT_221071 [Parathielavia appendiculata]|uniref:Uncharacterized protein n=1 Tax=Parathielavia appendiculata TaxID=2587402 RepID=A0AAN6U726_9PEZI|nr:hypothetical protein N657DRAFT_221071 [Parathielavia appendiculata]